MDERALLQRLIDGPASGDVLAAEAGQTRAAVWKRIRGLREAGVAIDALPGRGYRLAGPLELLDAGVIRRALEPVVAGAIDSLQVAWTVDSTNSVLLREPAPGLRVLLAERQTGGRGRRGRSWQSPLGANLYLSVARTFQGGLARLGGLSLVAGIVVAEALQACAVAGIGLKWPNDLVVDEGATLAKLGGVLVEGGGEHAGPVRAVIGIGLNVCMPPDAAAAIDQPWTDLQRLGATLGRNALAAAVLAHLLPALDAFDADGFAPFHARWQAFDRLDGRAVVLHRPDGSRQAAVARALADDGGLLVQLPDGRIDAVHAGEVSVRGAAT